VIGEGPEREEILTAASAAGIRGRVHVLGRVADETLDAAYALADVFVMPNVPVAGDMEGFGLVALEASSAGLPVVASALEGIRAAVRHGENGLLVQPEDAPGFARAISAVLGMAPRERWQMAARFASYTRREYGWARVAKRYVDEITPVVEARRAA
jgi:phosphatidylinositol alpha-1,6-mannosyltransferase